MHKKIYSVYDTKALEIFGGLLYVNNDEVARRGFHEALAHSESPLSKAPADYELLYIGTLDTQNATITPQGPDVVARGTDWLNANKGQA